MIVAACAFVGLLLGSFANVVTSRIPAGGSVAHPPSACPRCGAQIRPYDNVPVLSWLLLRGRCRDCGEPISPAYPLVELTMALLFALVGARLGPVWALPAFLLFTWVLVVVSLIDMATRKIPNRIMYPLSPVLVLLLVGAAFAEGDTAAALRVVIGGVGAFLLLLVIALIQPRGMGFGDVKLAGFIGLGLGYLGIGHVVLALFLAFLVGGLVGVTLLVARRRGRKDKIPFGPYLAIGALLALFVGDPIVSAYTASLGLS